MVHQLVLQLYGSEYDSYTAVSIEFSNTVRAERSERLTPYDTNRCPATACVAPVVLLVSDVNRYFRADLRNEDGQYCVLELRRVPCDHDSFGAHEVRGLLSSVPTIVPCVVVDMSCRQTCGGCSLLDGCSCHILLKTSVTIGAWADIVPKQRFQEWDA